jgi:hypothetical protein
MGYSEIVQRIRDEEASRVYDDEWGIWVHFNERGRIIAVTDAALPEGAEPRSIDVAALDEKYAYMRPPVSIRIE